MPEEIDRTELLHESTQRLVRTVDSLPDDGVRGAERAPRLDPGATWWRTSR